MNLSRYRSSLRYRSNSSVLSGVNLIHPFELVGITLFFFRSKCEFNIQAVNMQGRWVSTGPFWTAGLFFFYTNPERFFFKFFKFEDLFIFVFRIIPLTDGDSRYAVKTVS